MPNFNITATSAKANTTVSNTEPKKFNKTEFENQEAADKEARNYAAFLNRADHLEVWDWVGKATAV